MPALFSIFHKNKQGGIEMFKEFKEFAMRGNVLDLAVAVIIGAAFGKIVTSLVNDLVMPIISIILGGRSFADIKYVLTPAKGDLTEVAIRYGAFIQAIIDFLIIALVIFIFVKIVSSLKKKPAEAPATSPVPTQEEILLTEIRDLLKSGKE